MGERESGREGEWEREENREKKTPFILGRPPEEIVERLHQVTTIGRIEGRTGRRKGCMKIGSAVWGKRCADWGGREREKGRKEERERGRKSERKKGIYQRELYIMGGVPHIGSVHPRVPSVGRVSLQSGHRWEVRKGWAV